jgi:hypothetical protein
MSVGCCSTFVKLSGSIVALSVDPWTLSAAKIKFGGAKHRHRAFARDLSPYYCCGPTALNFRDRTGTGAFAVV